MARVLKIDNAWKKRFERVEKKRAVDTRSKRVYFLIVCEGEKTEPNYFKALEKNLPKDSVELEIEGTGRNAIGLVNYTIRKKDFACRKYDSVWVVFDKDSFPDENFNNAILIATANKINCAWTNEAFELWFLLHFQFVNNAMSRDEYKAFLEREIKNKSGDSTYKYVKNDPATFSILETHGNSEQAEKWANQLMEMHNNERHATHNPCTRVHKLIWELSNPEEVLKQLEDS